MILWSHANVRHSSCRQYSQTQTSPNMPKKRSLWRDQILVGNQGNIDAAMIGNTRKPIVRTVNVNSAVKLSRGWQKPADLRYVSYLVRLSMDNRCNEHAIAHITVFPREDLGTPRSNNGSNRVRITIDTHGCQCENIQAWVSPAEQLNNEGQ